LKSLENKSYPRVVMTPALTLSAFIFAFAPLGAAFAAQTPAAPAQAPALSPYDAALEQLASEDSSARRRGIHALGELRKREAFPKIAAALDDSDAFVRSSAIDVLGRLRATEAVEKIASLLRKDPESQVRQQAAVALSYIWTPAAEKPLVNALDDKAPGVRYAAARTLGAARSKKAVKRLNELLVKDKSAAMRRSAAGALLLIRDPSSRDPFLKALKDSDPLVRREAAKALARHPGEKTARALRSAIDDEDAFVPIHAIEALAKLREAGPSEEAYLLKRLADRDVRVRSHAANALGRIASNDSLETLEKAAAKEKHAAVKRSLQFAIDRIRTLKKRK
jgi:HEAT repeat protein